MPPRRSYSLETVRNCGDLNPYVTSALVDHEEGRIRTMTLPELDVRLRRMTDPVKMFVFANRIAAYNGPQRNRMSATAAVLNAYASLHARIITKLGRTGFTQYGYRLGSRTMEINILLIRDFSHLRTGTGIVRPNPVQEERPVIINSVRAMPTPVQEVVAQAARPKKTAERLPPGLMRPGQLLMCPLEDRECLGINCAGWRTFSDDVGYCGLAEKPEVKINGNKHENIRTIIREGSHD